MQLQTHVTSTILGLKTGNKSATYMH